MPDGQINGAPSYLKIGIANGDIPQGTVGIISIYHGADPENLVDTGFDVRAIAVHGDVMAGQWVYVVKAGGDWEIISW